MAGAWQRQNPAQVAGLPSVALIWPAVLNGLTGAILYSYSAKEDLLGIAHDDLLKYGAVSQEIARQMAEGARKRSGVAVTVSATGIAGPGGGMEDKPVGLVYFGWCIEDQDVTCEAQVFSGDRKEVRQKTVLHALNGILTRLEV